MTDIEIEKLKSDLAAEKAARETAESALATEIKAKETAEELLEEQNAELKESKASKPDKPSFSHKNQRYALKIPSFQGIPGYAGRKFTIEDCKENTVEVKHLDEKKKETTSKLVDYLLFISAGVLELEKK